MRVFPPPERKRCYLFRLKQPRLRAQRPDAAPVPSIRWVPHPRCAPEPRGASFFHQKQHRGSLSGGRRCCAASPRSAVRGSLLRSTCVSPADGLKQGRGCHRADCFCLRRGGPMQERGGRAGGFIWRRAGEHRAARTCKCLLWGKKCALNLDRGGGA